MVLVGLDMVFTKLQVPIEGPLVRATARSITNSRDMLVIGMALPASALRSGGGGLRKTIRWLSDLTARRSTEQVIAGHSKSALHLVRRRAGAAARCLRRHALRQPRICGSARLADAAITELRDICRRYPMHASSSLALRPVGADDRGYLAPPNGRPAAYIDIPYIADLESTGLYTELENKCLNMTGAARGRGSCTRSRKSS